MDVMIDFGVQIFIFGYDFSVPITLRDFCVGDKYWIQVV